MASLNHTPNYGLTQYSDNGMDTLSFLSDYNHDMLTIDLKLNAIEQDIKNLVNSITKASNN